MRESLDPASVSQAAPVAPRLASFEVAHETLLELAQQPAQAKPRPANAVQKVCPRTRLPS